MPTKQQQDAINQAQLDIMGETEETLAETVAGIKEDLAKDEPKTEE